MSTSLKKQNAILKGKQLSIKQEELQLILAKILTVLQDFGVLTEQVALPSLKTINKAVSQMHQLDLAKLANPLENLPDILYLTILFFSARPFYHRTSQKIQNKIGFHSWQRGYCPVCGQPPFFSYLKQDDGAKTLACGLCGTSWPYPRQACPFCKSTGEGVIRYFYTHSDADRRVYVCETCHTYLKTVDLSRSKRKPNLFLENIATPHLDLLAQKSGYFPPHNLISALILSVCK